MSYELRVERERPLDHAELESVLAFQAGFELRGSREAGDVAALHDGVLYPLATWRGRLFCEPSSDWQVAQLALLASFFGASLVGEDGEAYVVRDGIVELVNGAAVFEFGKLDELLGAGPTAWSA